MSKFELDDRVCVMGKNICGTIAYIGKAHFSKGEWFGIILDEPQGRNNGGVDGTRYFRCRRNYGIFVRACQLEKESTSEKNRNTFRAAYPNYLVKSTRTRACHLDDAEGSCDQNINGFEYSNHLGNSLLSKTCDLDKGYNYQQNNDLGVVRMNQLGNIYRRKSDQLSKGTAGAQKSADLMKVPHPRLLIHSSRSDSIKCPNKEGGEKEVKCFTHVKNDVIGDSIDVRNSLSEEPCYAKEEKADVEEKLKMHESLKCEYGKMCSDLNKLVKVEEKSLGRNNAKDTTIESSQNNLSSVSKELDKAKEQEETEDELKIPKSEREKMCDLNKMVKVEEKSLKNTNNAIESRKNNLSCLSEKLCIAKKQKKEAEEKLKSLKSEFEKNYSDLNKKLKAEKSLKNELMNAKKEVDEIKREFWKSKNDFELSEKKRRKLEMQLQNIREITEYVIIEKEIAEEKCECLEFLLSDETEKCKQLNIESEIMKEEMQIQCFDGVPAVHHLKKLKDENAVLNNALHTLRDMYSTLQEKLSISEQNIEKKMRAINNLKETEKRLENVINKYREEADELNETVDGVLNADDILFEVTARNLDNETEIRHLHQKLDEIEEHLEVSEEISETLGEIKLICAEEIESLKLKIKYCELAIDQKNVLLKNKDIIIDKYRELTKNLRHQNLKISQDLEIVFKERREAVIEAESLKLKKHQAHKRTLKYSIELENLKIELVNAKEQIKFWSHFMPDTFFEPGRESIAIHVKLAASKLLKKLNVLISNLKALLFHDCRNLNSNRLQTLITGTKFLTFAFKLRSALIVINSAFDRMDLDGLSKAGKYYDVVTQMNFRIDQYLSLLCSEEIDRKSCLNSIQNEYLKISGIFDSKYVSVLQILMADFECSLNITQISCKCIIIICAAISTFGIAETFRSNIMHASNVTERLETNVYKILNLVHNSYKENIHVQPYITEMLKKNSACVQEDLEYFSSIYSYFSGEGKEIDVTYPGTEETRLLGETILKIEMFHDSIDRLQISLKHGEFISEHGNDFDSPTTVETWARSRKRQEKEMIADLKNQIVSCEREIINFTQKLMKIKSKRSKWIGSDIEKPDLNDPDEMDLETPKMHVDIYPKGDSKEVSLCSGYCTSENKYLLLKLQDMECSARYLTQKNFQLKIAHAKAHQKLLEPLRVLPKVKYYSDDEGICIMQKKLRGLMSKLRRLLVPLVIDITRRNEDHEKIYNRYLFKRMLARREIEEEIMNIACEIRRLKQPRYIWSNSNPFSL